MKNQKTNQRKSKYPLGKGTQLEEFQIDESIADGEMHLRNKK